MNKLTVTLITLTAIGVAVKVNIKAKDIKKIALLYNGTQYAKNQYDVKISQYYKQFRGKYGT